MRELTVDEVAELAGVLWRWGAYRLSLTLTEYRLRLEQPVSMVDVLAAVGR